MLNIIISSIPINKCSLLLYRFYLVDINFILVRMYDPTWRRDVRPGFSIRCPKVDGQWVVKEVAAQEGSGVVSFPDDVIYMYI